MLERQQADVQKWVQRVVHLQPGDAVRVRGVDRDGKIVRVRLDLHRAEVDVGSFSVEVPLGDVLPPETPAPPPKPAPPPRPRQEPPKQRHEGHPPRGDRELQRPNVPAGTGPGAGQPPQRGGPQGAHEPRQQSGPRDGKRPPPEYPSLTDEQAAKLETGERVYVKRFHRDGVIIRVVPEKKVAAVSVGLLEVEVPFSGLAQKQPRSTAK
jgi:dsDNA-specific endonuclease/ATPase MutS2